MNDVETMLLTVCQDWFSEAVDVGGLWAPGPPLWGEFAGRCGDVLAGDGDLDELIAEHDRLHGSNRHYATAVDVSFVITSQATVGIWSYMGLGALAASEAPYDQDDLSATPSYELARCISICAIEAALIPKVAQIVKIDMASGRVAVSSQQYRRAFAALSPYFVMVPAEALAAAALLTDHPLVEKTRAMVVSDQ